MKKLICLTLSAILLAAVLASCAVAPTSAVSANIRLTSSDGESAAAWLSDRLGDKLTDRIVLGTKANGYGVDVSALEADGYVIRSLGGEIALLAKSADGLDRAVRKYAKMVEAGAVTDVTYHEGYRVKRIEIAGRDIAEYTIYTEDNKYLSAAAKEFAARIAEACGAALPVAVAEPSAPYISLRYVHDDALNTCGYRWSVNSDGLTIECSDGYKPSSPTVAVRRFLEKNAGWFGLSYGYPSLEETDLIPIAEGSSGSEANAFSYYRLHGDIFDKFTNDVPELYPIRNASHGMQSNRFGGELSNSPDGNWSLDQPCYLDEEFFEVSLADVEAYIQRQLNAGKVIGESFFYVDMAAGDNNAWCTCKKCTKLLRENAGTNAAAVVTWANRISETLDESYPGLKYLIFAYFGTNKPPKTVVPNDLLYITYCFDLGCAMHSLDGQHCISGEPYGMAGAKDHDNVTMARDYLGWCSLTKNMYVWFYGLTDGLLAISYVHHIRDDIKFLRDGGAIGVIYEAEDSGYSTNKATKWLAAELLWNVDMSDEEYEAHYTRVLQALYGDAAELMRNYIEIESSLYAHTRCAPCWIWGYGTHPSINGPLWAKDYDTLFSLIETAIPLAESAQMERRLINHSCECIFKGSLASYFEAYNAYDDERVAELIRRYALIDERLSAYGVDMTKYHAIEKVWPLNSWTPDADMIYETDLEVQAWKGNWADFANWTFTPKPARAMPERVAEIFAERGE